MNRANRQRALLAKIGRLLLERFGPRKFTLRARQGVVRRMTKKSPASPSVASPRLQTSIRTPAERSLEEPLGSLFWTVLSQNTTDLTAERAYRQLRRAFRSWRQVLEAPRGEVEAAIRVCGLAEQKARTIQEFLRRLEHRGRGPAAVAPKRRYGAPRRRKAGGAAAGSVRVPRNRLSLAFLKEMPADRAMAWLVESPGIGTKTAAVLLLFAFGRPVFPVDTHIRRVSGRIGFVPEGTPADKAQEVLSAIAPASAAGCAQLHLDIIRLGREICHPREPECPACPLARICRYARSHRVRAAGKQLHERGGTADSRR